MVANSRELSGSECAAKLLERMDPRRWLREVSVEAELAFGAVLFCLARKGFGKVRVVAARRSWEMEARLFGRGRSRAECRAACVPEEYAAPAERKVTWCRPDRSLHVAGRAMDLDLSMYDVQVRGHLRHVLQALGMGVPAAWSKGDYGHVEYRR